MTATTANEDRAEPNQRGTDGNGDSMPKGNHINPEDILRNPIPGPKSVQPEFPLVTDYERPTNALLLFTRYWGDLVRKPTDWFRENVVEPNKGPKQYWYHRKYPRVLPVDECYADDKACIYEADIEYKRLHAVDRAVLDILRHRRDACHFWHTSNKNRIDRADECRDLEDTYNREETNFHIKYGDLQSRGGVIHAYNKQKMRMIVDRRRALKKEQEEA